MEIQVVLTWRVEHSRCGVQLRGYRRRLMAAVAFSFLAALTIGGQPVAAQAVTELPILFVRGFCAPSDEWNAMLLKLQTRYPERFGDARGGLPEVARLYSYRGQVKDKDTRPRSVRSGTSPNNMYAIDFVDDRQSDVYPLDNAFDPHLVSNISVRDKGRELNG